MNFFKDYRKRLAWFGILLVAIVLSQTPMALLGLLAQTEIPSIWSGIIISLVSIFVLAIFAGNLIGGIMLQLLNQTTTSNQQILNNLLSESSLIAMFFLVVLIAPICEEIICRGIIPTKLFQGYEKVGYVLGWLLFLLAHVPSNFPSFIIYGWMSAVLTWTAYTTRRLEMSIAIHMVLNSVSFILLTLVVLLSRYIGM